MAEKSTLPTFTDAEIEEFVDRWGIADNDGIRPLHRVLFQQLLRPFRAVAARVRRSQP